MRMPKYRWFQWEEREARARFVDAPYEWWMEGGQGELGAFIGVVRTQNLDPDTTVYSFSHNYNSDGKTLVVIPRGVFRNQLPAFYWLNNQMNYVIISAKSASDLSSYTEEFGRGSLTNTKPQYIGHNLNCRRGARLKCTWTQYQHRIQNLRRNHQLIRRQGQVIIHYLYKYIPIGPELSRLNMCGQRRFC